MYDPAYLLKVRPGDMGVELALEDRIGDHRDLR